MRANIRVPKLITDKNGKLTTVHVNPFETSHTTHPAGFRVAGNKMPLPKPNTPIWSGKVQHEWIRFDNKVWDIAPEGFSGGYCEHCGSFFTKEYLYKTNWHGIYNCANCGEGSFAESMPVGIEYDSQRFLDTQNVRDEIWYHSTVVADWEGGLKSTGRIPMVHLGTVEAASVRANFTGNFFIDDGAPQVYMYAVRVKGGALVSPRLLTDENDEAPYFTDSDAGEYEMQGLTRYVNKFEAQGTISLIANPESFEVVERFTLERPEPEEW